MKKKEFDCVEMKREIQQQILEEMQGLSPEEQLRRTEKAVTSDPILERCTAILTNGSRTFSFPGHPVHPVENSAALLVAQGHQGINSGGAAGGDQAGGGGHQSQSSRHQGEGQGV